MSDKIKVRVSFLFEYDPKQLKKHPAGKAYCTWDVASDRQRAEHAATYDFLARVSIKKSDLTRMFYMEIIDE